MTKKALFLIVGFGMITAGAAGITTTFVDQKNKVALEKFQRAQEESRSAALEQQKKLDEKRKEIESMTANVQAELQRVEANRLRLEESRRLSEAAAKQAASKQAALREAAAREPAKAVTKSKPNATAPQKTAKAAGKESAKKRTLLSQNSRGSAQGHDAVRTAHKSLASSASKSDVSDVSRKAGMEAARLFEPIRYYNQRTRQLVTAEPFDSGEGSVHVRVRIWMNARLVDERIMSFSEASLRRGGHSWSSGRG